MNPNPVVWFEIYVNDMTRAVTFYESVFFTQLTPLPTPVGDDGAAAALVKGRSLLPSGVARIEGRFDKGDSVRLQTLDGAVLGVSLAAYAADEMARIQGRHSTEIEALVGRLAVEGIDRIALMGGLAPSYRPRLSSRLADLLVEPAGDALDGALGLARRDPGP